MDSLSFKKAVQHLSDAAEIGHAPGITGPLNVHLYPEGFANTYIKIGVSDQIKKSIVLVENGSERQITVPPTEHKRLVEEATKFANLSGQDTKIVDHARHKLINNASRILNHGTFSNSM